MAISLRTGGLDEHVDQRQLLLRYLNCNYRVRIPGGERIHVGQDEFSGAVASE